MLDLTECCQSLRTVVRACGLLPDLTDDDDNDDDDDDDDVVLVAGIVVVIGAAAVCLLGAVPLCETLQSGGAVQSDQLWGHYTPSGRKAVPPKKGRAKCRLPGASSVPQPVRRKPVPSPCH